MSSSRNAVIVLLSSFALVGASALAITACSSSSSTDGGGDSGTPETSTTKPRPDSGSVDPDSGSTKTAQECYNDCLNAHPTAKAAYASVDQCWADKCQGPCYDQNGMFDAGTADADAGADADAAPANDAGGLCGTAVGSGVPAPNDTACDNCTTANCCTQWADCYTTNHDECVAIDECLGQCPSN